MRIRRRNRRTLYVGLGIFVAVFLFCFLMQRFKNNEAVDAASVAGFDPGYIISDYQMSNYNSMDEGQIQNFLKSMNSCNDTSIGRYTGGQKVDYFSEMSPPVTWHVKDGHFVCMADEVFNGGTAAHIIYRAAQDYQINPQVLLVLLEKEQSLVRDTFPHSLQYRSATGYGCPDTAACSSKYYGLNNQVRNAAALFRTVLNGGWTNYPLGNNYIQYNPNPSCGGSVVNVRNLATSALYRYTPYQPNAATLGGWNDGCNAYGNMNFYKLFEEWFGGIRDEKKELTLEEVLQNMTRVTTEKSDLGLLLDTHISRFGWVEPTKSGGEMAGTVGYGLSIEAIKLELDGYSGIEYKSYVEGSGWEVAYKKDGEMSGTTGRSLRLEGVQIRLSESLAINYDVYYRVHVSGIGWMDWAKNGEVAGDVGNGRQLEAMQVKVVKKNSDIDVEYIAHVADFGWMDWAKNSEVAGTTGRAKRLESLVMGLGDSYADNIRYRAHVAGIGWMDWVGDKGLAGTIGQARQVEALEVELINGLERQYDIYYRAHVAGIGWMDWVKNGEVAGTTGRALQMEAIQVKVIKKE